MKWVPIKSPLGGKPTNFKLGRQYVVRDYTGEIFIGSPSWNDQGEVNWYKWGYGKFPLIGIFRPTHFLSLPPIDIDTCLDEMENQAALYMTKEG